MTAGFLRDCELAHGLWSRAADYFSPASSLPDACMKLTNVTPGGSINVAWVKFAGAGTSLFGGRAITRRGMCMYIEMESWS